MSRNFTISTLCALSALLAATTSAYSEETPVEGATIAESRSVLSEALKNVGVSFDSRLYGPPMSNPFSSMAPDTRTGGAKWPITTEDKLNITYRLGNGYVAGATAWFYLDPVREHSLKWEDPSIFLRKSNIFSYGIYRLDGSVRLLPGVGDYSYSQERVGKGRNAPTVERHYRWATVRFDQTSSIQVPGSRWRASAYIYVQRHFLRSEYLEAKRGKADISTLFIPGVEYRFSPNLVASVSYKLWNKHYVGRALTDLDQTRAQLGPSLSWRVTENFTFAPGFDFAVAAQDKTNFDTATLGFFLNWRLL